MSELEKKRKTPSDERLPRLRDMDAREKRRRIESGTVKFRGRTLNCNGYKLILATNCTINGNNNHVRGNNNFLFGIGNTADGENNRLNPPKVAAQPPPPPPPVINVDDDDDDNEVHDVSSSSDGDEDDALDRIILESFNATNFEVNPTPAASAPSNSADALARSQLMPELGSDPKNSKWKACLLDLPGEPTLTKTDEMRCVICLEMRHDTIFEPCGHLCCCRSCARQLHKDGRRSLCPNCRQEIKFSSIVF